MITMDNIISHEIIGLRATISQSSNPQIIGLNGTVVDETKSMITIKNGLKIRNIPKNTSTWKFDVNGNEITLHGSSLEKRPADRLRSKI